MPRGLVHVAGSERRLLSYPGSTPSQTILEIHIRRGGISIQGPPIWAVPGSLHFYAMHGCGSIPSATDGNSHTQLSRRLAHSFPVRGSFNIAQNPPPRPLMLLGAQGQLCQEHTVTQPASFVSGHSYRLSALAASIKEGTARLLKAFQKMLGLMAVALPVLQSASHATHPLLAEAKGFHTPPRNVDSGLCVSPGPLEGPPLAKARRDLRHGAQKEGCHDRRFQQGLGSAVRRQTDLRSLVRRGVGPAHQLSRNANSVPCQSILPAGHTGTPCASTLRQQVRGVIPKSPGRPRLEATLHAGE